MKTETMRLDRVTLTAEGATLLAGMNLHIFKGEIMGLMCFNSYGLESLIALLCRNIPIHYGYVYFEERLVNSYRRSSMLLNHVTIIEKNSSLVENLTVADNIFVLRRGFKKYVINPSVLERQLAMLCGELGFSIDGGKLASELTAFEKCVVELLRAIVAGSRLIILRDIGSFIGAASLKRFQGFIRHYADNGASFLYISSHSGETFPICDRVALMENGKILKILDKNSFANADIKSFTAFHGPAARPHGAKPDASAPVLEFRDVGTAGLSNFCLRVNRGECIVLADADNSALPDIEALMRGDIFPETGGILLNGKPCGKISSSEVCVISENPIREMLFPDMSYLDNLCFTLGRRAPGLWLNRRIRKSVLQEYAPLVGDDIFARDIGELSVFSLYNLVYYRVHLSRPKVAFCISPFAGADIYLRYHLSRLIGELREQGIAVVILAVNLSDGIVTADRLLTFEKGRLQIEEKLTMD